MGEFNKRKVLLLASGHFVNDCFSGFLAPLLPLFMDRHGLSVAQAGLLASVLSMSTSLSQPLYGYLADRTKRRLFLFVGPAVTATFMGITGLVPGYAALLIVLIIAGAGSASYHPAAAAAVSESSGARKEWGMSWFLTSGNFGHSLGPVVAVPVVLIVGLARLPVLSILGVVMAVFLYLYAPPYPVRSETTQGLSVHEMRSRWGSLALLFVIVVVRAFLLISFSTFIPIYLHDTGVSLLGSGAAVTLFLAVGSLGALIGGRLSPRLGPSRSLQLSMLLALPALIGFLHGPGWLKFPSLAMAGLILYFSFPLNVVIAQELFPRKAGTVSALMIGVGWGTAGAFIIPAGILADQIGISAALSFLTAAALLGLLAAVLLPRRLNAVGVRAERARAELPVSAASP